MKILDWYILKKFFVTFLFTILALTVIAVVIDSSEKADDFVRSGLTTSQIIDKYYKGFIPFIISMIFPLMVFIAVIFFTAKLAAKSEIVAILANGIRFNRFLRPYFVGGVLLALVLAYCNAFVFPKGNAIRSEFQINYIDRNSSYSPGPSNNVTFYLKSDPNTYVAIRGYDTAAKVSNGFFMNKIRGNQVYYNLRSDYIRWDTAKHTWVVQNAIERSIDGIHETVKQIPQLTLKMNITPRDLRRDEYLKDKLNSPDLREFVRLEEQRGTEGLNTYKVEYYRRIATPFSVIILTMLGAVLSSRKTRGGSGLYLAFGMVSAALFVVMDRFSVVFSTKGGLDPLLAAWIPNIIFGLVTLRIYQKAPK
ncbi:MAG TPA: LptF/LptG family permease [Chitinophagaceae bacterium]|jgi:lipopolysaccharide export system permease protein